MNAVVKKMLLVCSFVIVTQALASDEQKELKEHFLNKIDAIIGVVENKELSKEKRNSYIVGVLTPTFDFELMAKLSLGKIWKKIDTKDREKFVQLYVKRMENSYSSKLDAYSNEKVEVVKINQPKSNRISLDTNLVSTDESLDIVYKFYKPKKKKEDKDLWLIYDVEIKGVSILKADKAQFSEFLKTKSIKELIDVLIEKQ